jgi:hypothetical protein
MLQQFADKYDIRRTLRPPPVGYATTTGRLRDHRWQALRPACKIAKSAHAASQQSW